MALWDPLDLGSVRVVNTEVVRVEKCGLVTISRLVFTNAIAGPGFRLSPSCSPIRFDLVFPRGCLFIRIVNDKGRYRQHRPIAGMSRVGTAFHRPFEQDMGLSIGTSFIIQYLCWQARERLGDTCLKCRLFAPADNCAQWHSQTLARFLVTNPPGSPN